jgi:hypothetical protein
MSRAAQWITSTLVISSLSILTGGCATKTLKPEEVVKTQTKQKVFLSPYDEVWRAAHTVLKYPIVNENQDTGLIETDYIKAQDGFVAPDQPLPSSGLRYKITMIFAKGKSQGQESVRVTIDKKIEKLRDFFSEAETLASDGLEEKVLFYRMERELLISKGLRKASEEQQGTIPE